MAEEKKKIIKEEKKVVEPQEPQKKEVKKKYFYGVGSRKEAKARVRIYKGAGAITVNDKKLEEYLERSLVKIVMEPLSLTNTSGKFDISVKVTGGGSRGQSEAIRHGISRALVVFDEKLKLTLKKAGYITRDPREKERKKYGLKRARKAPQYRKR